MGTLLDYLSWRGDLELARDSFNEVDGALLARLSYVSFDGVVPPQTGALQLERAARVLERMPDRDRRLPGRGDLDLLRAAARSARFGRLPVGGYVNRIDEQTQTQFSATLFSLADDLHAIAFRGTDDTLVGWKEDFNMSFTFPVPAQRAAVAYLEQTARQLPGGEFLVCGHSKGGNLAVYAAAFCAPPVRRRVRAVYNYDGPGFDQQVLGSGGYREISSRVRTFVPQTSIVGMLLEHEESYTIVRSRQIGLMQHDLDSWEVERNHFCHLDHVTNTSRVIDRAVKQWVAELPPARREQVIDTIYQIVSETNARTMRELGESWFENARRILRSVRNLDEPTRRMISQTLWLFLQTAKREASRHGEN